MNDIKRAIRNKFSKKQRGIPKEQGRSMVEMLGVLAIIGVLSIGGIAGYTMAMNRYKANQIVDLASKLGVMVQTGRAHSDDWNSIREDAYNELGMEYYGYGQGGMPAYEVTFTIREDSVWAGSYDNGTQKALRSITGDDFFSWPGTAGPIIDFE